MSPSCWGCHCALGPVGWHAGWTHPKCAGLGHLIVPTASPAPGCVVGRKGVKRAGMRRMLGGHGEGMLQDTKVPQFLGFPPTAALPVPHCWGLAVVSPCLSFPKCQGMLRHRRCQLFVRWLVGWGEVGGGGDGGPRDPLSHPTAPAALAPSPPGSVGPKPPWCGSEPQLPNPCDLGFTGAACGVGQGKTLHLLPRGFSSSPAWRKG